MASQLNKHTFIFLLSAIGLIVFPHVYNLPGTIIGLFYALLAWRFIAVWKQNWLPGKLVLLLLTVTGLALLYSQHHGFLGRDAGTRLFVVALGLKLMEIKSNRDIYLITFLAFIVAASQFLYQQSIVMAAYILFVCTVLLATLVSINSTHPENRLALKTAGVIILQAIPITVVVFILFPRVAAPHWMYFNDDRQAKMGLTDTMEPGTISELSLSDQLVFRVRFTGAIPAPAQRYWRGPVLTLTDGKKWTQSQNLVNLRVLEKPSYLGNAFQYTLLMEPQDKNWVFALDLPADYPDALNMNANYQLLTSKHPEQRAEYNISSYPNYKTGKVSTIEINNGLQLPSQASARITQLVRQLDGFDSTPENFINRLLHHFKTEDFRYTLKPPLMEEQPIESFLFDHRAGFCSHYAAAFVYLMRVAHIPARIVTGYQGGELNKVGNFLDIRQAHAHAWTEVWLQNQGWVRVDPTAAIAPERIERDLNIDRQIASGMISFAESGANSKALGWLKQTRQFWGNVDYNWQRWVINYDNTNQTKFLAAFGIIDLKTMMYWMMGIIAVFTALLSFWLFSGQQKTKDPVLMAYQRFCQKLSKHGLSRQPGEGADAFGQRIKTKLPKLARQTGEITALFIKLRYGKHPSLTERKRLIKLISQLKIPKSRPAG